VDKLNLRKASFVTSHEKKDKHMTLKFIAPSRGIIGLRSDLMANTKGTCVIEKKFLEYRPFCGLLTKSTRGAIISMYEGRATSYALKDVE